MHLSYAQIPRRPVKLMDLKEVFRFVAPTVRDAAIKTADQLNRLNIRYALQEAWQLELTDTSERRPTWIFL